MSPTYTYTLPSTGDADPAKTSSSQSNDYQFPEPGRWTRSHHTLEAVKGTYRRNAGLLLVMASQMFFSLMNLAVKKLSSIDLPVSTLELILVRMGITYICSVTYMLLTGVPSPFTGPKGIRWLLVFRGFSGFFSLFGVYFSLQFLSLSDATVLTFLAPLCTAIAGALFLGEKLTRREALAGLLSLVGVILIARPPFIFRASNAKAPGNFLREGDPTRDSEVTPEERLIAVGVALIGVLGATGVYTSLRAIGKRAHPLHALVSYSTQCVVVASIGMVVTKTPFIVPTRLDWLAMLVMIGIFGFIAQILLTMGLARETAGRGTMAIYTQIVFATIFEQIFFNTMPTTLSAVGTFMIISCALYVALTKESSPGVGKLRLEDGEDSMERGALGHGNEDSEHQKDPEHEGQEYRDEED
ncbi:DUF6-domain-containing protein [Macrolepiota fuliginosa MF-IS2]|uniref:DUF6-domain-containing protein n=1 Tax=Macrolepiota fuliginosa MF-IS2 TaxID=1400762 RepID=A0A9P5XBN2_9AGAR|nr:DUF6-domain-containing protein [Macrolepiota fuliginosa MF-IS2]